MVETVAIIPARGGSKGIINKNLRLVNGLPLIAHSIQIAKLSNFSRVLVFTDSEEIKDTAIDFGAEAPVLRPVETATDNAHMFLTYKFAIEYLQSRNELPHSFCALLPTTPLRRIETINETIAKIQSGKYDWVFSINEMEHHPFRAMTIDQAGYLKPFNAIDATTLWANRQELPKAFRFNGGTICGLAEHALSNDEYNIDGLGTFDTRVGFVVMSQEEATDIDSELDLEIVEKLMERRRIIGEF